MILLTGDTHGDVDIKKLQSSKLEHLTKDDYVIICGDCGVLFLEEEKEESIKLYSSLPFTVLFVDGNHENFDLLNAYPIEQWHGGKVHKITDHVIHLMRGQVFEIENKTFFTFGGGYSIDKAIREPHYSWWPQELPTEEEIQEGFKNLSKVNHQVDFVITHDCPSFLLLLVALYASYGSRDKFEPRESNIALERFLTVLEFKHWYFGHYHVDKPLTEKYTCLYKSVVELN